MLKRAIVSLVVGTISLLLTVAIMPGISVTSLATIVLAVVLLAAFVPPACAPAAELVHPEQVGQAAQGVVEIGHDAQGDIVVRDHDGSLAQW